MRIPARSISVWRLLAAAAGIVVTSAVFLLIFPWQKAEAVPRQLIPFPHVRMVNAGIPCLFCHPGATKSPTAGIPSVDRCIGCHKTIATSSPLIGRLFAYFDQPIPWQRINQLPRFVHFSHEVHVARGLNCETCHGDVGKMDVTVAVYRFNMGFCLDCHAKQPNAQQLKDCGICHY